MAAGRPSLALARDERAMPTPCSVVRSLENLPYGLAEVSLLTSPSAC